MADQIRGSIVVNISACHAEDPGSIRGRGELDVFQIDCAMHVYAYISTQLKYDAGTQAHFAQQ